MERKEKYISISSAIFVIQVLIILFARYQDDSTLRIYYLSVFLKSIIYITTLVNSVIIFSPIIIKRRIEKFNIWAIFAMLSYYFLTVFYNYNGVINYNGFLMAYLWCLFCLSSSEIQARAFKLLKKTMFYICVISIICYFSYAIGGFIPYRQVQYYTLWYDVFYIDYGIVFLYKEASLFRLCGICNEPGFFGTIIALLLCSSNLNLKDKKNWVLLLAGFLTFSVAFVFIVIIFFALNSIKNKKSFLAMLLLLSFYFFVLPNIDINNVGLKTLINRITITSNGIVGDNRSSDKLDQLFNNVLTDKPFFGMGNGYVKSMSVGAVLSYKTYVVNFGIIGCLLFWGSMIIGALKNNKNNKLILFYIIVFFLSIYQRPNVMSLPYCVILYGAIFYIKSDKEKDKQRKEILSIGDAHEK